MGTPTVVGKVTTVVAILFTVTSFTLALLGGERASSVVREPAPATAPSAPAAPSTPSAPPTPAPTTPTPAAPGQGR
jgi:preprotein translocase subunit SecG